MARREENPQTLGDHVNFLTSRMERVERRIPRGGGGGGGLVYIQPDEPMEAAVGSLWLDTDSYCP